MRRRNLRPGPTLRLNRTFRLDRALALNLRQGACASAVAGVVLGGILPPQLATATPYSAKAVANGTIRPAGPRSGASGSTAFNVEGNANGANASFGSLDYSAASFGFTGAVTAINGPLTLSLQEFNASFTLPGTLNFYLTRDTTTVVTPGDTSATAPKFLTTALPDGIGTQFDPKVLIGTGSFTTTGNVNNGQVDNYTLNLAASEQAYLVGVLNGGGNFRLLAAPATNGTGATFAGFSNTTYVNSTKLTLDVTLDTPTLTWVGGSGNWDNATTNWRSGATAVAWTSGNQAVFNVTPAGTVTLTAPITVSRGVKFDVGGYTVAGSAANPLTLAGGTGANTVQVTNAADTATINAVVASTTGLNKAGAGTLVLSGANTFTGGVTATAGTLAVATDAALGDGSNGVALAGGTLRATASITVPSSRAALSGSGGLSAAAGATLRFENPVAAGALTVGDATNTGTVVLAPSGGAAFASADVKAGNTLSVQVPLTNASRTTLSGDGTVILAADSSSFTGGVQFAKGTGTAGPTVVLTSGTGLGNATTFMNAGAIQGSVPLTMANGANALLKQISVGGDVGFTGTQPIELFGGIAFFGAAVKTITVTAPTTITGGVVSSTTATDSNLLVKAGAATLTLSGTTNTYTGGTRVTGGILQVLDGSSLGTGAVEVRASAAAGTVLELQTDLAIADAAGLTLVSSGANRGRVFLNFPLTSDPETVNSLLVDGVGVAPGIYTAANLPTYLTGTGRLQVLTLAVPEPSSALAGLMAVAGLIGARRRRRRRRPG